MASFTSSCASNAGAYPAIPGSRTFRCDGTTTGLTKGSLESFMPSYSTAGATTIKPSRLK